MFELISFIGIILAIVGATSYLMARGKAGIEWDNPGWKSGMVYSYGGIIWALLIFASKGISAYSILSLFSFILIIFSLVLRKYTSENKKFTFLDEGRYGSLRHTRLVSFVYLLSIPPLWFIGFSSFG